MSQRQQAIRSISTAQATLKEEKMRSTSVINSFAENVFNERMQRKRLSQELFDQLQMSIKIGDELAPALADAVAIAMKDWALEKGATHYCHWFQPLTELTAEKHDALFAPTEEGSVIANFSGHELVRGEPDASSFPSGGLRTTFEARGYTAWDPSSPAFLLGSTLVIPTMFISYLGDALDKKTPLLRSMDALNREALRILRLFGDEETKRVFPTVGAEQEYFLIDRQFFYQRPDLITCGRTLFGQKPPKGQELEDQYLGVIPDRILQIMEEAELELLRLGIPVQTRHNEVAPSQYELAINFQVANLAVDHQMLSMEVLKRVASKNGMVCLLHEKPFANINGSGKHTNWSLATDRGANLLEPGKTPQDNAQFLLFCAAVVRSIYQYAPLLRASIASAGNDHRLGVHEAPPAIMSVFLGEQLFDIFARIQGKQRGKRESEGELTLGVSMLPKIPRHFSDRNRTSPFAFTGNKFEFRAVGAMANISRPTAVLNTIVADSLHHFANQLEGVPKEARNQALQTLLAECTKEFSPVLFEGDNYDISWQKEAAKRTLANVTNSVDALKYYTTEDTISLFARQNVYTKRELLALQDAYLSKYVTKIRIEASTASMIAHTQIMPLCFGYATQMGKASKYIEESHVLKELSKLTSRLYKAMTTLDESVEKLAKQEREVQPTFARDQILPKMEELRGVVDRLEEILPDNLWPLPKYYEMLFIR